MTKSAAALATAALVLAAPVAALAQEFSRTATETVVSVQAQSGWDHPTLMLDALSTVRIARGLVAVVRPWAWRRPDGTWTTAWYQMQARYERRTRAASVRVDGGIITSPIGLGASLMRADVNPLMAPPFYYVVPLPRFDTRFDRLQMMSGGYPLGVVAAASGSWWDLRGGATDSTPARPQLELQSARAPAYAQLVAGGGITPVAGLRVGVGFARGRYRGADTLTPGTTSSPAARATLFNVEGEYTIRYTRLSGEWVRNVFDTTVTPATATASYLQVAQTVTPRWFAAARWTAAHAPAGTPGAWQRRTQTVYEAAVGYRVSPEWTVRTGWSTQRAFTAPAFEHQVGVSLVWARRWGS
jgi:hypothetical protein